MATYSIYTTFASLALGANPVNYASDTIKVALVTSTYTPNQDTHDFFNDITNELATANGYTAGGATLGTKTVTVTGATNTVVFDAADTSWTATGGNIGPFRYAIVYKSTGTASTSPLIGYIDFGSDQTITTGNVGTIQWDATDGVFKVVAT